MPAERQKGTDMAGFKDILGHEQIISHLQNAITTDKVSHAYIINGPDKSGKRMLADAFAAALQCEEKGCEACGTCHSCNRISFFHRNQYSI